MFTGTVQKAARSLIFCLLIFFASNHIFASPETVASPKVETYDELVHAIREARAASQKRVDQAIDQEKVRAAWETGKLIDTHVLKHQERADYGEHILLRLSADLGTSHTELKYMLQFARTYQTGPPAAQLSWSHYQTLLSINDSEEREEVTKETVRHSWTRDRLREEVRKRQAAKNQTEQIIPELHLNATLGKVGVYRVIRATTGPFQGELALDLGFSTYYKPEGKFPFQNRELVAAVAADRKNLFRKNGRTTLTRAKNVFERDLYTYRCYVTEVIDGDTFKAVIDLGFHIVTEQKLRLRGLDAAEIESAEGREAKAFLEKQLTKNGTTVLIKTVKSDKYDRYLADVWIGETYLNQTLIDEGYAVAVTS